MRINYTSYIDVITNSSSEIYAYVDYSNITEMCYQLLNHLLKQEGHNVDSKLIFTINTGIDYFNISLISDNYHQYNYVINLLNEIMNDIIVYNID